jgi:hypothetical protein
MDYIDWIGSSGATYRYWFLADLTASGILPRGGNYAFVRRLPNGNFVPIYFGEAADLRVRIPNHDRWDDAKRAGVTAVMAHTTPAGEAARCSEERDLIRRWNPPLNVQHRKVS